MSKKEQTVEENIRKEMQQQSKEMVVITKRVNQLMAKSPAITNEERTELERLIGQELPDKRSKLTESLSKLMEMSAKK